MHDIIFELKDVHFAYLGKFPALCGIDLDIKRGEMAAVIGANGSGKSTLLQVLDGIIFAQTGRVSFCGRQLNDRVFSDAEFSRDFRRRVGFVFQNPDVQLFCPTVKEDILFGPLQLGLGREESSRRLEELISLLEIENLMARSAHQLSIGEKRKVAIASTLIIGPETLILDEPTAGLDPLTSRHIIDLLLRENAAGRTVITSTHDLHIVEEISETVHVFSRQKKIVSSASARQIMEDSDLLRDNNLIHIHSHSHQGKAHVHPHRHSGHRH